MLHRKYNFTLQFLLSAPLAPVCSCYTVLYNFRTPNIRRHICQRKNLRTGVQSYGIRKKLSQN